MKKFYRPDEIADLLQISTKTVYRWVKEGKLNGIKIGPTYVNGVVRIRQESLEQLIQTSLTGEP